MTDFSLTRSALYEIVQIDGVWIAVWTEPASEKQIKPAPGEDRRLLHALEMLPPHAFITGRPQSGRSPEEWICGRTDKGKPYFLHHPELCFSLSDSDAMTAVAFSGKPVGLDIQLHLRHGIRRSEDEETGRLIRMARRFYHPDERDFVLSDPAGVRHRFYRVWTAKESYVKYTGSGIDGRFAKFSVIPETESAGFAEQMSGEERIGKAVVWQACGCSFSYVEPEAGISLCLCTQMAAQVRFLV